MKTGLPETFILFDLEYTAWQGSMDRNWSGENEYREIIQIGALRVSAMNEVDSFNEFVRPEKNPKLSEFIIELTGITQKNIKEQGLSFFEALESFTRFVGNVPAFCFGRDTEVLEENAGFHGQKLMLSRDQFHDFRAQSVEIWKKAGIDIYEFSSGSLIEAFTKVPERRAHDAVNDMRNLLDAIRELKNISDR